MKKHIASLSIVVLLVVCSPLSAHAAFPIKEPRTIVRVDIGFYSSVDTGKAVSTREIVHFREKKKHTHQRSTAIYLAIISILMGGLALHRFYLGYIVEGIFEFLGVACFIAGIALISATILGGSLGLLLLGFLLMLLWLNSWITQIIDLIAICINKLTPKIGAFNKSPVRARKQRLGWDNN